MLSMELQLGLALPTSVINDFDLNSHVSDPKEAAAAVPDLCGGSIKKKRGFVEAFDLPRQTLPLLLWNNEPNDDGDDGDRSDNNTCFIAKRNDDGNCIVGWPPIKFRRMKICSGNRHGNNWTALDNGGAVVGGGGGNPNSYSKYVKVKMEGVGIARKIDLSRHHSYQTLTDALINMFGKCQQDVQGFKLAYQDREGDWLLAGDVPWRAFIQSVERLKLLRTGG